MPQYKTKEELQKRLEIAGVEYTQEMTVSQLMAIVETLPPDPAADLAASLPRSEMNSITTHTPTMNNPVPHETRLDPEPEKKIGQQPGELSEVELLRIQVETQKKLMEDLKAMVLAVSDKNRLAIFGEQNRQPMQKIVNVSVYNGQPVISWSRLITNTVNKLPNQPHTFSHTTEITYKDGTKQVVDYVIFSRDKELVKAIVDKESKISSSDVITLTVQTKNYGTFEIDSTFIN